MTIVIIQHSEKGLVPSYLVRHKIYIKTGTCMPALGTHHLCFTNSIMESSVRNADLNKHTRSDICFRRNGRLSSVDCRLWYIFRWYVNSSCIGIMSGYVRNVMYPIMSYIFYATENGCGIEWLWWWIYNHILHMLSPAIVCITMLCRLIDLYWLHHYEQKLWI